VAARRAGNIHGEGHRVVFLKVALDVVGAGVDRNQVAPFVQQVGGNGAAADIAPRGAGFPAVVIGRVEAVDNRFIPIIVKAVKPEVSKLFKFLTIELKDKEEGLLCPAYFKKQAVVVEDIINDPAHMEWKELHERFGAAGGAAIPIVVDGKVDYILVLYDTTKDAFNKRLIPFYKDLHLILSLMLKSIRTFYEKEHIKELYNPFIGFFKNGGGIPIAG